MVNYLTIFCRQDNATGEDFLGDGIFCNRINNVQLSRTRKTFFFTGCRSLFEGTLLGNDPIPELKTANTNRELSFSTDLSFQQISCSMLEHGIILVSSHQRTGIAKIL